MMCDNNYNLLSGIFTMIIIKKELDNFVNGNILKTTDITI